MEWSFGYTLSGQEKKLGYDDNSFLCLWLEIYTYFDWIICLLGEWLVGWKGRFVPGFLGLCKVGRDDASRCWHMFCSIRRRCVVQTGTVRIDCIETGVVVRLRKMLKSDFPDVTVASNGQDPESILCHPAWSYHRQLKLLLFYFNIWMTSHVVLLRIRYF